MRPIPQKVKKQILEDSFYEKCCITGLFSSEVKIDWHHNFKYAGKQIDEKWSILPLERYYKGKNFHQYHEGITKEIQEKLDWIMLNRATDEELKKYSKCIDLIEKRKKLNKKFV